MHNLSQSILWGQTTFVHLVYEPPAGIQGISLFILTNITAGKAGFVCFV